MSTQASSKRPSKDPVPTIELRINGEPREVPAGLTVTGLLSFLGVRSARVAVERNRAVVPRTTFEATLLEPNDEIEIVSFIGGG